MPDNDFTCTGVGSRRWGKPLTQFAQWELDPNSIAHSHLKALKSELQHAGNEPIYHLQDQAQHFSVLQGHFQSGTIDLIREIEWIRHNARQYSRNTRYMELAVQASQQRLHALIENPASHQHFRPLARYYVENVFRSRYEDPVRRFAELEQVAINERFAALKSTLDFGMDKYAEQLDRRRDINKLRMPRGLKPAQLSGDELDDFLNETIGMAQ